MGNPTQLSAAMNDMGPLTDDELWELNDALNEVIYRMLKQGMTDVELKYDSLAVMWRIQRRIVTLRLVPAPEWVAKRDIEVAEFMKAPRIIGGTPQDPADVPSAQSSLHH